MAAFYRTSEIGILFLGRHRWDEDAASPASLDSGCLSGLFSI